MLGVFGWGDKYAKNTFKPLKSHKKKGRSHLHQYSYATLGAGNTRLAVKLPERAELNEWLATNLVDFYNQIAVIYGILTEQKYCTDAKCSVMSAGPKYQYLWCDGTKYKKPTQLTAPKYVEALLDWVSNQLDDPKVFPVNDGDEFPDNFESAAKKYLNECSEYMHTYIIAILISSTNLSVLNI
eukprot:UN32767